MTGEIRVSPRLDSSTPRLKYTVLDRFHDKLLKKMLGGKACRMDIAPDGRVLRYRVGPSGQIRRLAGSVKIVTELRVARLKWLQGILADLDNHRQYIIAFFRGDKL